MRKLLFLFVLSFVSFLFAEQTNAQTGTTLYGALYESSDSKALGIYSIKAESGSSLTATTADETKIRAGVYINGKYHALIESVSGNTLTTYDVETWSIVGTPIAITGNDLINSMAYDFNTGNTYALAINDQGHHVLAKIDLTTGQYELIDELKYYFADLDVWEQAYAAQLVFNKAGDLYVLYREGWGIVDASTAQITLKYRSSHQITGTILYGDAVIDFETNKLYYTYANMMSMGSKGLFEVDLDEETYTETQLVSFNSNNEVLAGLFIKQSTTEPLIRPEAASPLLLGTVISATTSEFKRSIYTVNTSQPAQMNFVKEMANLATWDAVYIDGKYYAYVWDGRYDDIGEPLCRLTTYDAITWDIIGTPIYSNTLSYNDKINVMTYDVSSGDIYTVNETNYIHRKTLGKLNLETGVCTAIDTLKKESGEYITLSFLASDSKGNLFGLAGEMLCSINTKTGVVKEIASTRIIPTQGKYLGGIIDPATDILYWSLYNSDSQSIYATNLTTANSELVYTFTNKEEMVGLVILEATPEASAPASVSNLSFTPSANGALTGVLSFDIPTKTVNGNALSGTVDGVIYCAGQEYTFVGAAAGSTYTRNITISEKGNVLFRVSTYNNAGMSSEESLKYFVGKDTPKPVTNVTLVADEGNENKPKVSWTAPTEGMNGGYLDVANLRYDLRRFPDNVVINELTTPFYSDNMPEKLSYYYYQVIPYINGEEEKGNPSLSNEVLFGSTFEIPYENVFDESNFKLWTQVDVNDLEVNWGYEEKGALSPSYPINGLDSWFISPPINFAEEGIYELTYTIESFNRYRINDFNVYLGVSTDISSHEVLETYRGYQAAELTTETVHFMIKEGSEGIHHLSFQVTGTALAGLYFNNINIKKVSGLRTPAAVSDIYNTWSTDSGTYPKVSFLAPTKEMGGDELTSITKIELYRNDQTVASGEWDNPAPGERLVFSDVIISLPNQMNTYRIIAYNSHGAGEEATHSLYAGEDIPNPITDLLIVDEDGKGKLTWTAPTLGVNNGYVDPSTLTYRVSRNNVVLAEDHTSTTYIDTTIDTSSQSSYTYTVEAKNSIGTSEAVSSNVLTYKVPYAAPFYESFANKKYDNAGWSVEIIETGITITNQPTWLLGNIGTTLNPGAQDGDNGYAYFASYDIAITKARLISPLVDISNMENPVLSFWFYHNLINDNSGETLTITASKDEGGFAIISETIKLDDVAVGWTYYEIPLDTYKGAQQLRIGFDAYTQRYGGNDISIDNIAIENKGQKDLTVFSITPMHRMQAGATAPYSIEVRNAGLDAVSASDYTVEVYKNGILASEARGITLTSNERTEIIIDVPASLAEEGSLVTLYGKINYPSDEKQSDNISEEITVNVVASAYAKVTNLRGEAKTQAIDLNWQAPANPKTPVDTFDSFEDYQSFIISYFGKWKVVDNDQQATWYPSDYFQTWYANKGTAMAFQIFNASSAGVEWMEDFNPRTGKQAAISWSTNTASGITNNDWLISPELTGAEQVFEFYAKAVNSLVNERFVPYFSTSGTEISDFTQLSKTEYEQIGNSWKKFSFEIPEETKYFAINRITPCGETALILDDFLFFQAGSDATITGYNIYRDGAKLNSSPLATLDYSDTNPSLGVNKYKVTAVYGEVESPYSNEVSINFTGNSIDGVDNLNAKVYSLPNTIIVEAETEVLISIYNAGGAIIYNEKSKGKNKFTVNAGVYVVKLDNKATKVIVK